MKEPKYYHGEEELVYYSIILWPVCGCCGATVKTVYKTTKGAEKRAMRELGSGLYTGATIRKEEVFLRDENNEFSSSGIFREIKAA